MLFLIQNGSVRCQALPRRAAPWRSNAPASRYVPPLPDVVVPSMIRAPLYGGEMTARIQNTTPNPDLTTGVQHLFKAIYAAGVPQQTLELVHLRASQINGCSFCVDAGSKSAEKKGMSTEKLLAVPAWYESELFDDAERAALALTEAATRLADRPGAVTDEIWAEAAKHFN